MTRFIFVRHGESEANVRRLFAGHLDAPLTARGLRQAELTAGYLSGVSIDAVYASDLRRAFVTGERIAAPHGLAVRPDPALREINGGEWEGVSFAEVARRWPDAYGDWMRRMHLARCPGGESIADLQARVRSGILRIAALHPDQTVLIATHATPIRVMELVMRGWPLERVGEVPWVTNASVTIAEYGGGAWRVTLRSADAHLGALSTALPANI